MVTVRRSSRDAPAEAHALQPPRCRTRLCCCAVFPLEGHQAFSSGPFKGVEQHKWRKLSSSRSSDDLRAGRHQATRIKACPRARNDGVATVLGAQEEALSSNFLEQRHACLHTVRERLALVLVAEPKERIKLNKRCPACHLPVSSRPRHGDRTRTRQQAVWPTPLEDTQVCRALCARDATERSLQLRRMHPCLDVFLQTGRRPPVPLHAS